MKVIYRYNPESCQYEPVFLSGKQLLKRSLLFLGIALGFAVGGFFIYVDQFAPLEEQFLQVRNAELKARWSALQHDLSDAQQELEVLIQKDDKDYRVILDMEPLSNDQREAGVGGTNRSFPEEVLQYNLISNTLTRLEKLKHKLEVEKSSFNDLTIVAKTKRVMWLSRPAIQPLSNSDVLILYTTYGMRRHPGGFWREHKGLDFKAPQGTPVYATGDGFVSDAYISSTYGNVVFIDHNFGYETRYAHLTQYIVKKGDPIKRGQIIGYVGNTGYSFGAHLHYEVLYRGDHLNPINFFQRDLSNQEYEKLIKMAGTENASMD